MKTFLTDDCKLKRIRYESSGGSMNFHSDFELEADADEVIRTAYWCDHYYSVAEQDADRDKLAEIDNSFRTDTAPDEITVREHIPMDKALWDALSEEFGYLRAQLREVEKTKPALPSAEMFVLDGGDYTRLYLTWEKDGEEITAQYYCPSGKRWSAVIAILHEMVRPVGRDLHRIGETQMTEMFLKAPKYSYQITPVSGDVNYYFFVHGDKSPISRISREQWLSVREFLNGTDLSCFGAGKYEDKYFLRLNYNDGINKKLRINKKTAEMLREFMQECIEQWHKS